MMSFSWAEHIFPTKLFRSPTRMHFVIPMAWWPPSRESLLPAETDRFRHSTFTRFLYDTWFIISLSNLSLSVVHLQILYSIIMYHIYEIFITNKHSPPALSCLTKTLRQQYLSSSRFQVVSSTFRRPLARLHPHCGMVSYRRCLIQRKCHRAYRTHKVRKSERSRLDIIITNNKQTKNTHHIIYYIYTVYI